MVRVSTCSGCKPRVLQRRANPRPSAPHGARRSGAARRSARPCASRGAAAAAVMRATPAAAALNACGPRASRRQLPRQRSAAGGPHACRAASGPGHAVAGSRRQHRCDDVRSEASAGGLGQPPRSCRGCGHCTRTCRLTRAAGCSFWQQARARCCCRFRPQAERGRSAVRVAAPQVMPTPRRQASVSGDRRRW
jgi:hypothetical protein